LCRKCNDEYVGETSRTAYTRSKEHMADSKVITKEGEENTGMNGQKVEKHLEEDMEQVKFVTKIRGRYESDALK